MYAHLAYRKALLAECISHLRVFTSIGGMAPKGKVTSEDVLRDDRDVPEEVILKFIIGLQQESESVSLERAKVDFVKREDHVQSKSGPETQESSRASATNGTGDKPRRKQQRGRVRPSG